MARPQPPQPSPSPQSPVLFDGDFDVGLSAWPALAAHGRARAVTLHGTDLAHPRSRLITVAALPLLDLVATVSEPLADAVPRWAARRATAVLPCGVDLHRFRPIPRWFQSLPFSTVLDCRTQTHRPDDDGLAKSALTRRSRSQSPTQSSAAT